MAPRKAHRPGFAPLLSGRHLIHRLIWIETICFGLLILFISLDDEFLIPLVISAKFPYSPQTIAGMLDSLGVVLLFLLALYIQLQVLNKIKLLEGILSVCANCKKVRDGKDRWSPIEEFIQERTHADFSHTICPDCGVKLYGDLFLKANGIPGKATTD